MKNKKNSTFIIKVLDEQHDSWQGSITLAETNETQYFRSALELIHMMDEVLDDQQA